MRETASDLVGRRITLDHTYAVEEVVHRGAMTALYAATWEPIRTPVILRSYESIVRLGLPIGTTRRIVGNVRAETALLRGAGLPDVVDIGEESQFAPFQVLRLPPGALLQEQLQTGHRLPLESVVRLVRTVAGALEFLRTHGVVHRGPTADRLWAGDDGSFVLLGAGEVLYRDDTVRMKSPAVSELLWHIPPESFLGSNPDFGGDVDHEHVTGALASANRLRPSGALQGHEREDDPRAEVYCLGCLAYAALNGYHPFFTDPADPSAGVLATLQEEPLPLADFPADSPVARAIIRAFARQPEARHATPSAFADALEHAFHVETSGRESTAARVQPEDAPAPVPEVSGVEAPADDPDLPLEPSAVPLPAGTLIPLRALRAWQAASFCLLALLIGYVAWDQFRPVSVIITSDPPAIALVERIGHLEEDRGRTPIVLRDRNPLTPIELQVVGPDGSFGPPATFTPLESRSFQDLGRCYRLPLRISFDE